MIITQCLKIAEQKLSAYGSGDYIDSARLDVEILLSFCLQKPRAYLYTWPEKKLSDKELNAFEELLKKRLDNVPVAYLTGTQEFWSQPFKVSPSVLIPRPETECLIEVALQLLPKTKQQIVDLGTGSGVIAIILAKERSNWTVSAIDKSIDALSIARENARALDVESIQFLPGSWYRPLGNTRYDAIVSNPPYVANQDPHLASLNHEPESALSSGHDGLDDIRAIIEGASSHLNDGGFLILEHGYDQQTAILDILRRQPFNTPKTFNDLSGTPRIIAAQKSTGRF